MITLKFLISMWKHDEHDRVSLWEGAIETGRWLGQFSVDCVPEEYKKKLVVKFQAYDKYDEDPFDYLIVLVE